jgi:hypothetical protein
MEDHNKMDSKNKGNLFKVPKNYFETLPDKIIAKAKANEAKKPEASIKPLYVYVTAIAASLLILAVIIFNDTTQPLSPEEILADISTSELIDYLADTDINTDDIMEEVDWTDVALDFNELDYLEENITEDDLDAVLGDFDPNLELI